MLKLTCQDKDKVSLILPVLPSGAPLYIVLFFLLSLFSRRHLVLPSLSLLLMLLFVSVLDPNFPGFFFLLFIYLFFFNMISGSCWKSDFVLLTLFFF